MGTGTNVQKKLIAVHDLDIPWRPADLEQRAGRIIRQGNENKQVQIFRYVTKGTFDAYSYQTLENKQKFISQIMTSKTPARKCEDVDQQALTYSEIKALCTGDERIKEKLMLENEVKELRVLAAEHRSTVFEMEDKIARFPEQEQKLTAILADLHSHILLGGVAEGIVVLFGEGNFLAEHRLLDLNTFDLVQLDFLLCRIVKFGLGFITLRESLHLFLIQPPDLVIMFAVFLDRVAVTS